MGKRKFDTTPFVSLFLILTAIVVAVFGTPRGVPVVLANRSDDCGDGITILAHVRRNGDVTLNHEEVKRDQLERRLKEIFGRRVERILFLQADAELPFQDVVNVISTAQTQVEYVALITPSVAAQSGFCLTVPIDPPLPPRGSVKVEPVPLWPW